MSDFKLSSYYPAATLSQTGKWFYDNVLGSMFEDENKVTNLTTFIIGDVTAGDSLIEINSSDTTIYPGDAIYLSNQFVSKVRTEFTAIPQGGSTATSVKILDPLATKVEKLIVKSISKRTITLTTPVVNSYRNGNKVFVRSTNMFDEHIVLENPTVNELVLHGAKLSSAYLLRTYATNTITYEIPLASSLFAYEPDPNTFRVRYIDSRNSYWIDLIAGIDFKIIQGSPTKIQIINDPNVINRPSSITTPIFRAVEISYRKIRPSDIEMNNSTLQHWLPAGKYYHDDGTIVFDSDNNYVSGIPTVSDTMMSSAGQLVDMFNALDNDNKGEMEALAGLLGVHNRFDTLPSRLGNIILDSTDIFLETGTENLIRRISMMLGIPTVQLDNVYALTTTQSMKLYEVFYRSQHQLPTYTFVETLFGYNDESNSITQTGFSGYGVSGAYTSETADGTIGDEFTFVIGNLQLSRVGLQDSTTTMVYNQDTIDYAIELRSNGEIWVYQGASLISSSSEGNYTTGDIITIQTSATTVTFYLNGVALGTTLGYAAGTYRFAAVLSTSAAGIIDITKQLSDGTRLLTTLAISQNVIIGFSILGQKMFPFLYQDFFRAPPTDARFGQAEYSISPFGKQLPSSKDVWTSDDLKRAYAYFSAPWSHNMVLTSVDFLAPDWFSKNITINNAASSVVTVNDLMPVKQAVANSAFEQHSLSQNVTVVGSNFGMYGALPYGSSSWSNPQTGLELQPGTHFLSIYAKYDGESLGRMAVLGTTMKGSVITYDVLSGTIVNHTGSFYTASDITLIHSGWYRISMQFDLTEVTNIGIRFSIGSGNVGTNEDGMYLWGAALTQYDLESYASKLTDFNGVIQDTIDEVLRTEVTHDNNEILALSQFAVTTEVNSDSLLTNPTSFLVNQIDSIKPFTRDIYEIDEDIREVFEAIPTSIVYPHPLLYSSMQSSPTIEIGLDYGASFTRTSAASYRDSSNQLLTFVDPDVARHEGFGTGNHLSNSETFTNTTWAQSGVFLTSNVEISPNGMKSATTLESDAGNTTHTIKQVGISLTAGSAYTFSLFVRDPGNETMLSMLVWDDANESGGITLDPATGIITRSYGGGNTSLNNIYNDSRVSSFPNGWYRYELTVIPVTSQAFNVYIATTTGISAPVPETFTGDPLKTVQIFGAQLEQSTVATSYNRTGLSSNPEHVALLMEDVGINLILDSEVFVPGTTAWTLLTSANMDVLTTGIASPDGATGATSLTASVDSRQHSLKYIISVGSGSSSIPVEYKTFSCFVQSGGSPYGRLEINNGTTISGIFFDISAGTIVSSYGTQYVQSKIVSYANSWYRLELTVGIDTTAEVAASIFMDGTISNAADWAGNGSTSILRLYGAQFEVGTGATSYIQSIAGVSGTRTADTLTYNPDGNIVTSDQSFTVVADIVLKQNSNTGMQEVFDVIGETTRSTYFVNNGGFVANGTAPSSGGAINLNVMTKVVTRYDGTSKKLDLIIDGTQVTTTTADIATGVGTAISIGQKLNGLIGNFRIYDEALSDQDVQFISI